MTKTGSMLRKPCDRLKAEKEQEDQGVAELAVPAQACHHHLLPPCPL